MFDIEYKGGNTVAITTKKLSLITDPKLSLVGLKDESVTEKVELATEPRFVIHDDNARLVVEGPGEYEVGDFSIRGVRALRHIDQPSDEPVSTIYRIEVADTKIALLGNIAPELTETQLEDLGMIDILILPVGGGGYTLDATSAASITRQIGPRVVIPVHYADKGLAYEVPQEGLEVFAKELGAPLDTQPKMKVKSATTLPDTLTIIELTRS